jgi:hypothetical protein
MQIVFSHYATLNVNHITNWKHMQDRKQKLFHISKKREMQNTSPIKVAKQAYFSSESTVAPTGYYNRKTF